MIVQHPGMAMCSRHQRILVQDADMKPNTWRCPACKPKGDSMGNKLPKQPPKAGPKPVDLMDDLAVCFKAMVDHGWASRNETIVLTAGSRVSKHADQQVALGLLRVTAGSVVGEA